MGQTTIAITIFLITYAIIVTEKINRAVISLLSASLLVLAGVLDIHRVFEHYIEWNTITLLIGMMILVGILNQTGVFQYAAVKSAKAAKGNPARILIVFSLLTALASAFLDNVTTVLLVAPITLAVTYILKVSPVPFFISEIIASNIGGTATLIGDPPNIMIGSANEHLTFNAFLIHLGPVIVVILAATLLLLYGIYRKQLSTHEEHVARLMEMDEEAFIQDRRLAKKSLFILGLTILGFVLHSFIHVEASVIAITGATVLMLIGLDKKKIEAAFDYVEWETIFFFAALFTLVGGLQEVGVIKHLAVQLLEFTQGNIPLAATLILWVSGIASAVIDNIPFVATMIPLIQDMATTLGLPTNSPEMNALWWSLALGACLGGNGTIIGASANVIAANIAAREGKGFSYVEYLKVGAPVALLSLAIAQAYLYLRYLIHF